MDRLGVLFPLLVHVVYIIRIRATHEIVARKWSNRRHTRHKEFRLCSCHSSRCHRALSRGQLLQFQDIFAEEHRIIYELYRDYLGGKNNYKKYPKQ